MRIRPGLAALAAAAGLAVAPSAAQAWVKTAKAAGDPQTTWIFRPHAITIRSADPVLLKFVRGSSVLLTCHAPHPLFWGRAASSITLHTRDAIPRDIAGCFALDVGRVPGFLFATRFSGVGFTPALHRRLAPTLAPGPLLARFQLMDYWSAISRLVPPRYLDRFGMPTHLPPAPALVRYADRRLSPARDGMLFAPTLAGVTVPRVVYVIGEGSGRRRLEFAVIGFDGRRYVLRARLGNGRVPKFGLG